MKIRKLLGAVFFLGLGLVLLVSLAVYTFNLSAEIGWIAFAIFAAAFLLNGLLINSEDKMPGSFYNPERSKDHEHKSP